MAQGATDVAEDFAARDCTFARVRIGLWGVGKPHQELELHPVRKNVQRVGEALVELVVHIHTRHVNWLRFIRAVAIRILLLGLRKEFIGDTHLDIVGLAGKHRDGLVLRLPAKTRNSTVIAAAVRAAGNPQGCAVLCRSCLARENFAVLDRVDQSQS